MDEKNDVLYVGKAKNLKKRVASYFQNKKNLGEKTAALVAKIHKIRYITVTSEIESLLLEANYIKKFTPFYNIRFTDGKSYPFIRITKENEIPTVLVARKLEDKQSVYFGPYPNASAMRLVLRTLRRILPYESALNHAKRVCLYNHLGLCPCVSANPTSQNKTAYKKTIRRIIAFLNGNIKDVRKDLEEERDMLSKTEQFEEANNVQRQILAIDYITTPNHKPFEYEVNPNLLTDLRQKELSELQEVLQTNGVHVEKLTRIECYDISNTSGINATGSMVVFTNGEKDAGSYRKFRIRPEVKGPNDFAMMHHVLTRRLKHDEWPLPDLFIVDGGKGQISIALQALSESGVTKPLVGLAKREEIIITSDFKQIVLPKRSPSLQLVMRIRNEAHRFAITYHKKLRSKATSS